MNEMKKGKMMMMMMMMMRVLQLSNQQFVNRQAQHRQQSAQGQEKTNQIANITKVFLLCSSLSLL
jgi:uncharacterized membrane protein